eukprot:1847225-Rhodomonas_salina.1
MREKASGGHARNRTRSASISGDLTTPNGNIDAIYGDSAANYGSTAAVCGESAAKNGNIAAVYGDSAAIYGDSAAVCVGEADSFVVQSSTRTCGPSLPARPVLGTLPAVWHTPKSNTRNRIPGTNRAAIAVSCIRFRGVLWPGAWCYQPTRALRKARLTFPTNAFEDAGNVSIVGYEEEFDVTVTPFPRPLR